MASAVAAIQTLLEFLKRDKGKKGQPRTVWASGRFSDDY